ncbi:MAG: C45 family autoproteolytic acyltransferase/hydrolase [Methanothrix sp.]|nr:C45 family autoproteolytic acyltransferase/hydrolase [Methanothrix sp.]
MFRPTIFKMRVQKITIIMIFLFVLITPFVLTEAEAIVSNATYDVLIKPNESNQMEVDHIIIRGGTQEEIGYELGRIGIEKFNSILVPYEDPIYGKAKEEYIHLHDPALYERIKGIKRAYGLKEDDYSQDSSVLLYHLSFPSCSAVYFPANLTENGHSLAGKDLEWFFNPEESDFVSIIASDNYLSTLVYPFRARNHVVELYPDNGYATLVLGSSDLNGLTDGMNENGLGVTALQDSDTYVDPITNIAGGRTSGLNSMQMLRSILENCATIEEAKKHILMSRISMPFMGLHFMIYDASGNATIVEFNKSSREAIFTDYRDVPVPMTNYALYLNPDFTKLIPENTKDPHDDYYRMKKLHAYIDDRVEPFNKTDVWNTMSMVQANANASAEGVLTGGTIRLVYMIVNDLSERTMAARFYLRDGPLSDPIWGTNELVLSKTFAFQLKR